MISALEDVDGTDRSDVYNSNSFTNVDPVEKESPPRKQSMALLALFCAWLAGSKF